ncbi:MAG TPA: 2-hydroxyacyl-CoA dehydratase family protein, partial [Vicinamibacteria bacterium]|nr:2-hydroxyacyl-CoA dehydratase family protein [Vicinamibacteria bacterium]
MSGDRGYQERMHLLQKEMMARYYAELTAAAEGGPGQAAYMLVSGNPVELIRAFDLLPVYPEVNALQLAVKKQALPFIQKAEEMGYSIDNCAYVKADIGCYIKGLTPTGGPLPKPALVLCNFVGCNTYVKWFEHVSMMTGA